MYLIRALISTPAILSAQPHCLKKSIPRRKVKLELMTYLFQDCHTFYLHKRLKTYMISFTRTPIPLCSPITLNLPPSPSPQQSTKLLHSSFWNSWSSSGHKQKQSFFSKQSPHLLSLRENGFQKLFSLVAVFLCVCVKGFVVG